MVRLNEEHVEKFNRDGFVIVEGMLSSFEIAAARARFEPLFSGTFETGLYPDEWNWRMGRDRHDLTRQICNAWKSDLTIASIVLKPTVGEAAARLRGWPGAKIGQDNLIWKPPGTKPLGFHQDDSYNEWIVPGEMLTCFCISSAAKFHPSKVSYIYSRYKKRDSVEMDESYFPVLWREDGYRSPWLDDYIAGRAVV